MSAGGGLVMRALESRGFVWIDGKAGNIHGAIGKGLSDNGFLLDL